MANTEKMKRSEEITKSYFDFLDQHIDDVVNGVVPEFMELNQIAKALFLSHQHLTDTVQNEMGHHPCYYYDWKIIEKIKSELQKSDAPIAEIARSFTYDPSNFSKFFKKFVGETPKRWRAAHAICSGDAIKK